MAVFILCSVLLLFICNSVFIVSTNRTESWKYEDVNSTTVRQRFEDHILQHKSNGTTSNGLQRQHNPLVQLMDTKIYAQNVSSNNNNIVDQHVTTQTLLNGLKFRNYSERDQQRRNNTESNLLLHSINSSVDLYKGYTSERTYNTVTNLQLTTTKYELSKSTYETNLTENTDIQLDNSDYLLQTRNQGLRINSTLNGSQIKRLPKAIIIGVKKAGTRALLEFLRMHPNVEGTGPEPHFFDRNYRNGLEWYRDLMPKTYDHQVTVEKTPGYFVTRDAAKRIFEMDPTIKLILVVRDPVTRAISDYCQAVSKHTMKPFENMALIDERLGLVNTSWVAIKVGVYAKHMKNWLQVFPLNQIHLVDGQGLIDEPAREIAKVETFLGLPKYINDSHFYLRGFKGTFPCLMRNGRPHCLDEKTKGRDHPVVKESVIQRLRDFYRPFNAKFFQMVGVKFDWS